MASTVSVDRMTSEEQRELFLWKWKDVTRQELNERLAEFNRFDTKGTGELEENQAMRLFESRHETKTALELREMFAEMDVNKDHKLSFLEWCCALYKKSHAATTEFVDVEARQAALDEAKRAGEEAARAAEEVERARLAEEAAARARAEELEKESKLTGVAGMSAFFRRQIESSSDASLTNEQKIKQEAARRRALREAKQKEKEALEKATKHKSAEEIEQELQEARSRAAAEEAAAAAAKAMEERAARALRKSELNAKWGGGKK